MRSSVFVTGMKVVGKTLWWMTRYYSEKAWLHLTRADAPVVEMIRRRQPPMLDLSDTLDPTPKTLPNLRRVK